MGVEGWKSFSHESMSTYLRSGEDPLLIRSSVRGNYDSGHSWIIDGYLQYTYEAPYLGYSPTWSEPIYHCVWDGKVAQTDIITLMIRAK